MLPITLVIPHRVFDRCVEHVKGHAEARRGRCCDFVSHNSLIKWFQKVNSLTQPSTQCGLLLVKQLVDGFVGELTI